MPINILVNGQTVSLSTHSDEFFLTGEGRIRVFNTGTAQATNVEVVVTVPPGLTINGSTPTAGVFLVDTWTLLTLDPCTTGDCNGEEEFLDLSFLITDDSLQPYNITYTVTHDQSPDDIPLDNFGDRTISGISCSSFHDCDCTADVSAISAEIDAPYDILLTDGTILVNALGASRVVTLPLAADAFNGTCGQKFTVKVVDNNSDTNTVTLSAQLGEVIINDTVLGANTLVLTVLGSAVTVQSNGTSWYVI